MSSNVANMVGAYFITRVTMKNSTNVSPGKDFASLARIFLSGLCGVMVVFLAGGCATTSSTPVVDEATGAPVLTYKSDVAPILKANCTACHGGLVAQKGLKLSSLDKIMAGGESGPAVVPGSPQSSLLYTALLHPVADVRHMPPVASEKTLTAAEIATIRTWIENGAN